MFLSLYFFQDAFDVHILVARSVKHSINFMDVKDLNRYDSFEDCDQLSDKSRVAKFCVKKKKHVCHQFPFLGL